MRRQPCAAGAGVQSIDRRAVRHPGCRQRRRTFDVASIEYAVANGYTKLIVVMGHQECGAVRAALDPEDPGSPGLVALVQRIRQSFAGMDHWARDPATVRHAVEANARASATYLLANSKIIRDAVQSGKVGIVVAYYNLDSGAVERVR